MVYAIILYSLYIKISSQRLTRYLMNFGRQVVFKIACEIREIETISLRKSQAILNCTAPLLNDEITDENPALRIVDGFIGNIVARTEYRHLNFRLHQISCEFKT